ncbi:hypothetical protein BofuT4_uP114020.1 [Botrytis cinerea T4]|uniref:Uncharacterized protein n=1 Tax=Botryotinia fuckeliana (strain T4) TaxID=999810 RepID=G2Y5F8_BOTF4|nr:hypothetical protein BofuT4_uP114020.1 [Botrytis cinerea T4]
MNNRLLCLLLVLMLAKFETPIVEKRNQEILEPLVFKHRHHYNTHDFTTPSFDRSHTVAMLLQSSGITRMPSIARPISPGMKQCVQIPHDMNGHCW